MLIKPKLRNLNVQLSHVVYVIKTVRVPISFVNLVYFSTTKMSKHIFGNAVMKR